MLNSIEVKSVLLFSFRGERSWKYEIVQCQSQQITLSKYVGSSCIPFIFMTIDMLSSSRIEKLPSSYSSESAK